MARWYDERREVPLISVALKYVTVKSMKLYNHDGLNDISVLAPVGGNKLLTGHENGDIKLWTVKKSGGSYEFGQNQLFQGSSRIRRLCLLPNGRLIASCEKEVRIWNLDSGHCEKVLTAEALSQGSVSLSSCHSIVPLDDGLMAMSGNCSPAWECFDVWDLRTGTLLFREQNRSHRAYGLMLATTPNGYLVVNGNCSGELSVWKVDRSTCEQVSQCDSERSYSISASPTGEIAIGGRELNVYTILEDGSIQNSYNLKTPKLNVIVAILPLGPYKFLAVDCEYRAGSLKIWDCVSKTFDTVGDSQLGPDKLAYGHVVLASEKMVLAISEGHLCIGSFNTSLRIPLYLAEVRKNARLLAQASRTNTSCFSNLPKEINIKIAAFTGGGADFDEKIASDHFFKPPLF